MNTLISNFTSPSFFALPIIAAVVIKNTPKKYLFFCFLMSLQVCRIYVCMHEHSLPVILILFLSIKTQSMAKLVLNMSEKRDLREALVEHSAVQGYPKKLFMLITMLL